ncbi:LacI family DNA-binding transcriptional regulator [Demequina sp. NBRC 110056]|uniref:LacI family DNA-binding transcriptional regulator n=1 Tax=Demequina sp. NBRC 110056 TaxID=1570345 RepID=UPI0011801A07|nr:LacI family DNA-binding transcriptional regulator [Demequina sp. NBRC 110056]
MTDLERTSPVTLHDVAREAGVSLATASRTLNGSTRNVKESNRQLVLAAAERLGYTANTSAQAVARGTTTTVALLVGDIADPYFSSIAAGVVDAAASNGLIVTMAQTSRDTAREVELVRAMRGQRARAIVLAASRRAPDPHTAALHAELAAYEAAGGRAVFITSTDAPFRAVPLDNHGGARELGERLHRLGYRNAAVLAGPGTDPAAAAARAADTTTAGLRTSGDRLAGFTAAFASAGSPIPADRIIPAAFTRDGGYEGMRELAERGLDGVDLVFAVNDVMAVGAMSAMRDLGIEPGTDIGVAGFDDIPTLRDVTPRLTTVRLPLEEVGAKALALALADGDASAELVSTEVIVRESTPGR